MEAYIIFMRERLKIVNADIDYLSRVVIINEAMTAVFNRDSFIEEQFCIHVLGGNEKIEIKSDEDLLKAWQKQLEMGCKEIIFDIEMVSAAEPQLQSETASDANDHHMEHPVEPQRQCTTSQASQGKQPIVDDANDVDQFWLWSESDEDEIPTMEVEDAVDGSLLDACGSDNEDLGPGSESEEEDNIVRMSRELNSRRYEEAPGPIKLEVGLVFKDLKSLRWALIDYSIQEGFRLKRHKFEKKKVQCGCYGERCPFRVYAALNPHTQSYEIRSLETSHNCVGLLKNPEASIGWLVRKCHGLLASSSSASLCNLQATIRKDYGIIVGHQKISRARRRVLEEADGDHANSYKLLWDYCNVLRDSMPGVLAKLIVSGSTIGKCTFERMMISYPALRDGFKNGCRPFIGLDGCHLKGPYKGILLSAVSIDANMSVFPIAVAVVEAESADSWAWFLNLLYGYLEEDRAITFMSDRQKGIINAVAQEWGSAKVRYCARHIFANFKNKFPELKIRDLFWAASRASTKDQFVECMKDIKEVKIEAFQWLKGIDPSFWSVHAFEEHVKCIHVTNNMTESWNAWLGDSRKKPIFTLLEHIRKNMMKTIAERKEKCLSWESDIPPHIQRTLNATLLVGRHCQVIPASEWLFEVIDNCGITFRVNLATHKCDCRMWQLSGLPCKHAMPCIVRLRHDYSRYVSAYFLRESYIRCYSGIIQPIQDRSIWTHLEFNEIEPPHVRRPPGRPKVARRRERDEVPAHRQRFTGSCSSCKQVGHNKRACPFDPINRQKNTKSMKKNRKRCGLPVPGIDASAASGSVVQRAGSSAPRPSCNTAGSSATTSWF